MLKNKFAFKIFMLIFLLLKIFVNKKTGKLSKSPILPSSRVNHLKLSKDDVVDEDDCGWGGSLM